MAENGDKSVNPDGLAQAAAIATKDGPAPVHLWNPPYCGEMDLLICADGTWLHDGSPIGRPAMVRLFASILKREGDRFFLVSPVEKIASGSRMRRFWSPTQRSWTTRSPSPRMSATG